LAKCKLKLCKLLSSQSGDSNVEKNYKAKKSCHVQPSAGDEMEDVSIDSSVQDLYASPENLVFALCK